MKSDMTIHTYGDPVLRRTAHPVPAVDDALRRTIDRMFDAMHKANGVGLAAQQVGLDIAVCVVEIPPDTDVETEGGPRLNPDSLLRIALVNPKIVSTSDDVWSMSEGCLSFPGITGSVSRPWSVTVDFLDAAGAPRRETFHGFLARAVQHEIDHLNAVLFTDHFSHVKKIASRTKLKRLRDDTLARLASASPDAPTA